jgi:hypothetical protein
MTDVDGGEDDEGLLELGTIFTVSRQSFLSVTVSSSNRLIRVPPHTHRQEPPRPPSPEPTIAVYENIVTTNLNPKEGNHHHHQNHHHHHDHDHDPNPSLWSTISVRLVGSHPLWGHHLYVQFTIYV